jgi:hypothetical protein
MFGTIFQHIQIKREDIEINELILGMMDASNIYILAQGVSDSQHMHYFFKTPTLSNSIQIVLHIPIAKFRLL